MKAIIFDLDGVICFTDKYHYEAWKKLADSLNIYFDEKINNRLRGVSRMESLEIILEKSSINYSQTYKEEFKEDVENPAFIAQRGSLDIGTIYNELKDVDGFVSIVDFKKESLDSYASLQNPIYRLIAAFFFLAVVLAFLVLLNLLVMFVDEKKRELIILMINGFSKKYARKYIYTDTIILTILGIIFGIVLGAVLGLATVKLLIQILLHY